MAKVVVLGAGVAGFSAAQELAERGFEVILIEKTGIPGGKARSSPVMPVGPSPWKAEPRYPRAKPGAPVPWVPGEHGFRFFPGFYWHVVDTMERIPTRTGVSVKDHLTPISRCGLTQYDEPGFDFPMRFPRTPGDIGAALASLLAGLGPVTGLRTAELAHFGARIWQILTSCSERRLAEYEKIPWWDFIGAASRSEEYQKFLAAGITRSLVAAHSKTASTRTVGDIFVQLLVDIFDPLIATTDRVLDGPTNEVWIYPWLQYCRSLGVTYMAETEVSEILCEDGRVTGVRIQKGTHSETIVADHYVCALPVERFAPLLSPDLLQADPAFEGIPRLVSECLEWMNGVQFYFRQPVRLVRGHMNHIDTEWALTSISQAAVWRENAMMLYGPGDIQGIVSVDVSDWDALAPDGRSATNHSREEVCTEVWRQLKRSVNTPGEEELLRDEDLVGWFIDSDIDRDPSDSAKLANAEPLLVNLVDSWRLRPEAVTAIPNFFLASDYVRTHTDLATMEAANEAARCAVNGILDAEGYAGSRCQVWPLHEPATLAPFRQYDAVRFGLGLPWDSGLANVASAAVEAADPMLAPVAKLIATIEPVVLKVQKGLDAVDSALPLEEVDSVLQPLVRGVQEQVEKLEASVSGAEMEEVATQVARSFASAGRAEGNRPSVGVDSEAEMGPVGFGERLDWYRSLAAGALRGAVPPSEPQQFLYEPIREFIARPAKGLRPALCIATCRAFGGRTADALSSAAGIELLHNAFLVHDDIEDGSEFRRGGPTLHRTLGVPLAVNIGDAMNALSMRLFRENLSRLDPTASLRIFDEVDHMLAESLEGQALELSWIRENNCRVTTDDYLRLVLKKTAWYSFIHPMRIGAITARPQDDELARFHAFGFLLGAAFQIQDDVLNLVGEEDRYGKEIGGDLWEGKRTLPLIHAFSHASAPGRARLKDFLARPREGRLPRQLFELNQVLQEGGSIEWARRVASALTVAARDALPMAYAGANEGPDLEFVRSLVDYLVARDV